MTKSILEEVLCRIKCKHFVEKSLQYDMIHVFLWKLKLSQLKSFFELMQCILLKWRQLIQRSNLYNNKCSLTKTKNKTKLPRKENELLKYNPHKIKQIS